MEYPKRSKSALRARRSGYEPSDTETEWQETPWHDSHNKKGGEDFEEPSMGSDQERNISPLRISRRVPARFELEVPSPVKSSKASPVQRRHSKSPFKLRGDDGNVLPLLPLPPGRRNVSPLLSRPGSEMRKSVSPVSKFEQRRHVSPYKQKNDYHHGLANDEMGSLRREQIHRQGSDNVSRFGEKLKYYNRSSSAPRPRPRDKDQHVKYDPREQKRLSRTSSTLSRNISLTEREPNHNKNTPSVGEINEIVANAKISRGPVVNAPTMETMNSIDQSDVFFSREYGALTMPNIIFPKNGGYEDTASPKSTRAADKFHGSHQQSKTQRNIHGNLSSTVLSRISTVTSSAVSRQSSNFSDASERTNGSTRKFVENRRKSQTEAWFSCINKGSCRTSKRSPERGRAFDEASFIERAFVVESLRPFWADKHRPASFNGFSCHKQEALLLKQLASQDICPHILLKGPSGCGKKALTMAYLREIFGDPAWNVSHDIKYFQVQEAKLMQVVVPVTSSPHHVELNVHLEPNAKYALMALVKQISNNHAVSPEISYANFKADYTVMVLYDVDKASENIQHLIKWIMDCYTDICKLVLCCEDDVDIVESVKTRCEVIKVDAPVTHEIMEVLIHIAKKENFDIPMSFAAKISTSAKQNLRKAIMALEACKAHNYPFVEDQPIPLGWEETVVDLAAEILADPSTNRLYIIRGGFQKLLADNVHPKLILQKLIEQFLKSAEATLKRELYYWHGYYDKRLPMGMSALLKLEEFVVKFMSIYRKSSFNHQYT